MSFEIIEILTSKRRGTLQINNNHIIDLNLITEDDRLCHLQKKILTEIHLKTLQSVFHIM